MTRPQPPSAVGSATQAVLGFVLLVAAHFGIRPLVSTRVSVDFLAIAILFAAVRVRPGFAAVIGFLAGLAVDALAPGAFGAATLVFTIVAFAASWTKAVFFADHVALTGLFIFVGKWTFDVGYTLVGGGIRGIRLVAELLLWAPLSAALTALVAVVLLTAFRPLFRPQTV